MLENSSLNRSRSTTTRVMLISCLNLRYFLAGF